MSNLSNVPLFDATAVNANFDLCSIAKQVIDSHRYILGSNVEQFERDYANYCGAAYCVGVANGTDALELALRAVGVDKNDYVVTVANAGFYCSTALYAIGAKPLYVDVDLSTLTLSPEALTQAIKEKPAAVVVTHLYGQMAEMASIESICKQAGIRLIEDCAQAHGATQNGRKAGTYGDAGCFSFYPTKNLGALGDGGAIITQSPILNDRLRSLRQYGWTDKYRIHHEGGRNSRLDEIQAAFLSEKLKLLDVFNEKRRQIAECYNKSFMDLPLRCPVSYRDDYVAHLYVIRSNERDALRKHLSASGISTDVHYPIPDHCQIVHQNDFRSGDLAVTENAAAEVLTLPCFPGMKKSDVERVVLAVRSYFERGIKYA